MLVKFNRGPRDGQARAEVRSMYKMLRSHLGRFNALTANASEANAALAAEKILEIVEAQPGFSPSQEAPEPSEGKSCISWADLSSTHSSPRSQDVTVTEAPQASVVDSWQVAQSKSRKKHNRRNTGSCTLQDRASGSRRAARSLPQYASWGRD